jgi:hypothetical protein
MRNTQPGFMAIAALVLVAALAAACAGGGGGSSPLADFTGVYLKNNIHYQARPDRGGKTTLTASYANYTAPGAGHGIVPVNTAVSVGKWRGGCTITRQDTGEQIFFEFNSRNTGMSLTDYLAEITSPTPVALSGLNAADLKGVKAGQAAVGMTKEGVRMALGYPAPHKTPSLTDDVWTYWRTRWVFYTVTFKNGKVAQVQ